MWLTRKAFFKKGQSGRLCHCKFDSSLDIRPGAGCRIVYGNSPLGTAFHNGYQNLHCHQQCRSTLSSLRVMFVDFLTMVILPDIETNLCLPGGRWLAEGWLGSLGWAETNDFVENEHTTRSHCIAQGTIFYIQNGCWQTRMENNIWKNVCMCLSVCAQSCLTLCDPTNSNSPLGSWNSPGNNTGVGCNFLLQGLFLQENWKHVYGNKRPGWPRDCTVAECWPPLRPLPLVFLKTFIRLTTFPWINLEIPTITGKAGGFVRFLPEESGEESRLSDRILHLLSPYPTKLPSVQFILHTNST